MFATYRTGGLDNLNELLHETGHAVHIAAIHTRPAFADWPDSDPLTVENLASTIYNQMGVDSTRNLLAPGNRPIKIVKDGEVVKDLLA